MHTHDHGTATGRNRGRLLVALAVTASVALVQVVGGVLSGSLALLADAGHMAVDSLGLTVALGAAVLAARPATALRSYGWQRAEVLAALVNGLLLLGVAVWVVVEAVRRWDAPPEVATGLMLGTAVLGGLANLLALLVLRPAHQQSLNLRGAYLEVLADLVGSVLVVVAALVIWATGWTRADVVASLLVAALVLPRAWSLLGEVVHVLLEATPRGLDLDVVREHLREVPAVVDVHDLHAWTITSGSPALSAHVVVDPTCVARGDVGQVLDALARCVAEHFDVEHSTFQLEPVGHREHEAVGHA
ncbi:cation diffusion facilitator family transporter [Jannaschia sp. R86511]|uniref:cation diffusion facilitator family transporter n=1 Tax=Jannaschia sp. R86511 TaxID=3093853 RepID=UPI0036D30D0E